MKHIYIDNKSKTTLLLLHGTGGNENDLINIGKIIDPEANILSPRGNINESGYYRFFKRYGMGKYDIDSLEEETKALKDFIEETAETYNFNVNQVIAVGFSNGANIAQSLLQLYGKIIAGAILFSPSYLQPEVAFKSLDHLPVFLSMSAVDPYSPFELSKKLEHDLKETKANLYTCWHDEGHRLSYPILEVAKSWYQKNV